MSLFLIVLAVYLLLVLALGIQGARKAHGAADFWIAGRRSSGLAMGGSLAATIVGGSSTLGLAGLAFRQGLTGSWWLLVGAVGLAFLFVFIKKVRARRVYTLPELIGHWYGPLMRKAAGVLILAAWLGIVAAQASAAGKILKVFLGGDPALWTAASAGVFILYTAAGGQISVIRTDIFQALIIVFGIGCCTIFGLNHSGGLQGLRSALGSEFFSFPLSKTFSVFDLSFLLLVVGSTYLVGPDMLSRIFCARSEKAAARGLVIAMAAIIPLAIALALCGMIARVLVPDAAPEAALPVLAARALPPWLAAMMIVALLSAFLSSADTTLLTMSAIVSVDLLGIEAPKRLAGPRLAVIACGSAAAAIALLSGGIIPSLLLGYSVFSGGLLVPVVAALLGKKMRERAALAAACLGGGAALVGKLLGSNPIVVSSFGLGLIVFFADHLLAHRDQITSDH